MKATELYETVTTQLIADIEAGAGDWRMPWHQLASSGLAESVDGRPYRGLNCLILSLTSSANAWTSNTWGTYKAWQRNDIQVTKGQRGTKVLLWKQSERRTTDDNNSETQRLFARTFTVFAREQTDALSVSRPESPIQHDGPSTSLHALGAQIRSASQPHYNKAADTIGMPERATFETQEHYLSTLAHECIHWTGHPSRLDRDLSGRFGDQAYGFEELVAEIGSAFWCAEHRITSPSKRLDHADYLADWLRILRADSRAILTASSKAQAAVDHLRHLSTSQLSTPNQ